MKRMTNPLRQNHNKLILIKGIRIMRIMRIMRIVRIMNPNVKRGKHILMVDA